MTEDPQYQDDQKINENDQIDQRNISYWQTQTAAITDEYMKSQVLKESMQREMDIKNDLVASLKHVNINSYDIYDMIHTYDNFLS